MGLHDAASSGSGSGYATLEHKKCTYLFCKAVFFLFQHPTVPVQSSLSQPELSSEVTDLMTGLQVRPSLQHIVRMDCVRVEPATMVKSSSTTSSRLAIHQATSPTKKKPKSGQKGVLTARSYVHKRKKTAEFVRIKIVNIIFKNEKLLKEFACSGHHDYKYFEYTLRVLHVK
jgi:hypothetical protein